MPDQLDNNVKGERAKKLAEIEEKLRIDYENSFVDEFRNVLCEEIIEFDGKIYMTGHTEEYVKTIFEAKEASPGDIVMVKMSGKRLKNMVFAEV